MTNFPGVILRASFRVRRGCSSYCLGWPRPMWHMQRPAERAACSPGSCSGSQVPGARSMAPARAVFERGRLLTLNPNPTNRDLLTVCDQCTARAFGWHWPIFDGIVICHPRVLSRRPLLAPRKVAVRVAVVGEPTKKERIGLPLLLTQPKLYPL